MVLQAEDIKRIIGEEKKRHGYCENCDRDYIIEIEVLRSEIDILKSVALLKTFDEIIEDK